jgi:23S rRNA (uracil1939-C5)-methyltransferase
MKTACHRHAEPDMSDPMPSSQLSSPHTVSIAAIGGRGDGIVSTDGETAHVAGVLPGESVAVRSDPGRRSRLLLETVLEPSPHRIAPACVHFGTCGGCALQHWAEEPYLAWKGGLVDAALSRAFAGAPPVTCGPAQPAWGQGRRRATLHGRVRGGLVELGFMAARTSDITDMTMCPVLDPALVSALPVLRALVRGLAPDGRGIDLAVTLTQAGLDVNVTASETARPLVAPEPRKLARLVDEAGIARLSVDGLSAITARVPVVTMGGMPVTLPSDGFLQATQAGEDALVDAVIGLAAGARKIADLFCGVGTFSLPLRKLAPVVAWEANAATVDALRQAGSRTGGGHALKAMARDLDAAPVAPAELDGFDLVVLDPPRSGAPAQTAQLARTPLRRIIYVSCDPVSFARDAAVLVAAGYRLSSVQAFDQFRWSSHVELVACFDGPDRAAGGQLAGAVKPLPSIRRPGQSKAGPGKTGQSKTGPGKARGS